MRIGMRFPRIPQLTRQAKITLTRFPLILLAAIIAGIISVYLAEPGKSHPGYLKNLLATVTLGIPFLLSIKFWSERNELVGWKGWLFQIVGLLILTIYFLWLPEDITRHPDKHFIRFFILTIGMHLLVSFAPFIVKNEINGFWHFNNTLFLRFLTAVVFSVILAFGLSTALAAIDNLFGVHIPGRRYPQMWFLIAWIFTTGVFLSGIPEDFTALNHETEYPRGLKNFALYVLIPVVLIYLIILYAYQIKILIEWNLPKGWVANLVLGFSTVGMFAYLLIYPIRNKPENQWLNIFSRWYFMALIPPVIMLHLAIWRRISDYGITVNRYTVLVLAVWLTIVVWYFVFIRQRSIKFIPITLFIVALGSAIGPVSAFSMAERSQVKRLRVYLERNHLLTGNRIQPVSNPAEVPLADRQEISDIIRYLYRMHGLEALRPWFAPVLQGAKSDSTGKPLAFSDANEAIQLLGFPYTGRWEQESVQYFRFTPNVVKPLIVSGFEYYFPVGWLDQKVPHLLFLTENEKYYLEFDPETFVIEFYQDDRSEQLYFDVRRLARRLLNQYPDINKRNFIPPEEMVVTKISGAIKVKLYFLDITGKVEADSLMVEKVEIQVLMGKQ